MKLSSTLYKHHNSYYMLFVSQSRMLMGTTYVADGLRAHLANVEEFVGPSQQTLMRSLYVTIISIAN